MPIKIEVRLYQMDAPCTAGHCSTHLEALITDLGKYDPDQATLVKFGAVSSKIYQGVWRLMTYGMSLLIRAVNL